MNNSSTNISTFDPAQSGITIDIKRLFRKMLSYWWLFLLCFLIALGIGYLFLRYSTFEYSSRAILLIKDAGSSGTITEQTVFSDQILSSGGKAMDNEIQILKSLTLMEKVAARLQLNVAYYRVGNVKTAELYTSTPFLLDSFELNSLNSGHIFYLEQEDYENFRIKKNPEDEGVKHYYNRSFTTSAGKFRIVLNPKVAVLPGLYMVQILTIENAAKRNRTDLSVERIGSHTASSVLELEKIDPVSEKAKDILNTLINVYNEEEIKDENTVLRNTLEFIDKRVEALVNELDSVEGGIQKYKSANEIFNDNAASSMDYTLGEIRTALSSISQYEIQKSLLGSLENFLTDDQRSFDLIPANLIAENPVLSGLVNQFNTLVLRNNQLSVEASAKNPIRIDLENQMKDLGPLILETIVNQKKDLQIPIDQIDQRVQSLRKSMSSIPVIEKKLIEKIRTQSIKENLFLYLLQKREETALAEAVTTAKTRTIDRARLSKSPIYPKKKLVTLFSILLGLIIPFALVSLLIFFDNKIDSEESLKLYTSIPILGRISHSKGTEKLVVKQGNRSAINEMFRLLRTNIIFLSQNKNNGVILLTSSEASEGKTFITINLGATLALSEKKVIVLGLDLRRPKLASYLNTENKEGISNYLIGQKSIDELIKTYPDQPNLHYITSGPVPPNPTELILLPRMGQMIEELKERYDYIIIDSPPMGLVSDALLLRKFVDRIFIVVRYKFTHIQNLKNLEEMYKKGELENSNIIFNDLGKEASYYGGGYGYKNDYYIDE